MIGKLQGGLAAEDGLFEGSKMVVEIGKMRFSENVSGYHHDSKANCSVTRHNIVMRQGTKR